MKRTSANWIEVQTLKKNKTGFTRKEEVELFSKKVQKVLAWFPIPIQNIDSFALFDKGSSTEAGYVRREVIEIDEEGTQTTKIVWIQELESKTKTSCFENYQEAYQIELRTSRSELISQIIALLQCCPELIQFKELFIFALDDLLCPRAEEEVCRVQNCSFNIFGQAFSLPSKLEFAGQIMVTYDSKPENQKRMKKFRSLLISTAICIGTLDVLEVETEDEDSCIE